MGYCYNVFGLTIKSEIEFHDLMIPEAEPDVVIQYGRVPDKLKTPRARGVRFEASPGEFLLRIDNVARYYVSKGNRINIEPENTGHEQDIRLFLMGSAMGALLHQRNILPVHGSAVAVNGKGVVFTGPSGVGKSTLAAGFHKQGHPLVADDICAISTGKNDRTMLIPGLPCLKLWHDTLKILDACSDNLKPVRHNRKIKKYYLPAEAICDAPLPVSSIFGLETTNHDQFKITTLNGMDKIQPLIRNTFRKNFLEGLSGKEKHFETCARIASEVSIFTVMRPRSPFLLDELMELVGEKL